MVKFGMDLYSLYFHIPFCERRCNYCDFNTYAGVQNRIPQYMNALRQEVTSLSGDQRGEIPVHTIYLGGGTPSLILTDELRNLLILIRDHFNVCEEAEITLEANPGTLSPDYLQQIRQAGFNRLSLGMQSASDRELKILGRIHKATDVFESLAWARSAGFDNVSLDLIYGLPGQSLGDWQINLEAALRAAPEHLSLYALSLEPHVPMAHWIEQGRLPAQDDDLSADMYELVTDTLDAAEFAQYEISNWARKEAGRDLRSRHNLQYWLNQPYLGFGAGAHGYADGFRTENLSRILAYMQRIFSSQQAEFPCGPALKTATRIDRHREMQETMMLGLRLQQGVSAELFEARFGVSFYEVFEKEIAQVTGLDLIEDYPAPGQGVHLTRRGRFLSNVVFRQFVD